MSEEDSAGGRSAAPAQIGRYRVDSVLGRGAMGVVYRGYDEAIDRPVAIKTIHSELLGSPGDAEWHERFRREARAAARCQHPHIVTIYEFGEHEGQPFIAMEFVTGGSLQDLLGGGTWPRVAHSLEIVRETLEAIGYAHGKGIIHRDLKPGNIMLLDGQRVKVTDFGIARLGQSSVTQHGAVVGTPGYMSFEQINGGSVDERADLFAIGVMLYQLLTGCMPFTGNNLPAIIYAMMTRPPPDPRLLNPTIPPALGEVVQRAVARDPEARFQSAAEFLAALLPTSSRTAVLPVAEPPLPPPMPPQDPPTTAEVPSQRTQVGTPLPTPRPPLTNNSTPGKPWPAAETPLPRGTPLPSPVTQPSTLPPEELARVTRDLTLVLGPIASVLVRKTAGKVRTLAELYQALASHIADESDRRDFLRKSP